MRPSYRKGSLDIELFITNDAALYGNPKSGVASSAGLGPRAELKLNFLPLSRIL